MRVWGGGEDKAAAAGRGREGGRPKICRCIAPKSVLGISWGLSEYQSCLCGRGGRRCEAHRRIRVVVVEDVKQSHQVDRNEMANGDAPAAAAQIREEKAADSDAPLVAAHAG